MNYYETLGVAKDASDEVIKKAYKKLAMQHHPDRGGDQEKFKDIQAAYDTLSDPQKRQQYDNPQQGFRAGGFGQGGPGFSQDFDDLISRFMNGRAGPTNSFHFGPGFHQPQPRTATIPLSILDAFNGCTKQVQFSPGATTEITVPGGMSEDEFIRVNAVGQEFLVNFRLSDPVQVDWGRNNLMDRGNVTMAIQVPVFRLLLGGWFEADMIDGGRLTVRIPKGLEANSLLKVQGRGYWRNTLKQQRGDCYLRIIPLIQKLEDISPDLID